MDPDGSWYFLFKTWGYSVATVDGQNPAPPGMVKTYQLVQDFVHQQYVSLPEGTGPKNPDFSLSG